MSNTVTSMPLAQDYPVTGGTHQVVLTAEEEAAILTMYDYGLGGMTPAQIICIDRVIGKLKQEIWP